ncbi:unnamed protein product [Eruca vesicaria subsp. sativa]|uniref:Uncharacterized protein n=1 Tax=Eruca vesicaria subsp. sativa TaxID=29727 RepID=A0ABC8M9S4_ERUVS|nr:unnamed protein product [Eruca vesicaria subsp. sativa]
MDNQNEEHEQPPNKLPDLTLFQQANSEIALAASQANSHFVPPVNDLASSRLSMIESDEDSEDEDEEGSNDSYYEGFDNNGFGEDEIDDFLEDQESSFNLEEDDFMEEEDEIDPDQLSYEELIALGEFIGVEKRGLTQTEIHVFEGI